LETYYNGAKGSPIQVRIYDKAREVLKKGNKLWFFDIWNIEACRGVWRVEFQIRRQALKQFGINELKDLECKLPGVWQYLTDTWFSLRNRDNENTSRRTIHEQWKVIQNCAERFGTVVNVERSIQAAKANDSWYVKHIAGCLSGFAAIRGVGDLDEAWAALGIEVRGVINQRAFADAAHAKALKLGREAA